MRLTKEKGGMYMEKKKISKLTIILILIIAILATLLTIRTIERDNLNQIIRDFDIILKSKDEMIQYYSEQLDIQLDQYQIQEK